MSFRLYVADAFWENRTRGYFPEVMEALAWKKVPHISEMELGQDEMGAETCLSVKAYGEYRPYDKQ